MSEISKKKLEEAVAAVNKAIANLDALAEANAAVIQQYKDLASEYNQAVVQLRAAVSVHANGSSCKLDEFRKGLSVSVADYSYYDPAKLPKQVLEIPGVIKSVDKKTITALLKKGAVSAETVRPAFIPAPRITIKLGLNGITYAWGVECDDDTTSEQ